MFIVLGIILYLVAALIASSTMAYVHRSDFVCFLITLFSIPILTPILTVDSGRCVSFWKIIASIAIYIIAFILFFI